MATTRSIRRNVSRSRIKSEIAMYRAVWRCYANLRSCAVASSVREWGCARSNHRRIRGKPLASPGQPWERRPATRGFACRRIPSLLESKRTVGDIQRLVRGALAHSFALCFAPNHRENLVCISSTRPTNSTATRASSDKPKLTSGDLEDRSNVK